MFLWLQGVNGGYTRPNNSHQAGYDVPVRWDILKYYYMMYQSGQPLYLILVWYALAHAMFKICLLHLLYHSSFSRLMHPIWYGTYLWLLTMLMTDINIAMFNQLLFNVLIWIYSNIYQSSYFLIFTGMTSPAPPNTRQVSRPLNLFIYLRHFERVAFKSGCSINKLLHCKPNTNTQCQKIPTSQNYSRYKLILSVFVC